LFSSLPFLVKFLHFRKLKRVVEVDWFFLTWYLADSLEVMVVSAINSLSDSVSGKSESWTPEMTWTFMEVMDTFSLRTRTSFAPSTLPVTGEIT